jgi:hypothetical protein
MNPHVIEEAPQSMHKGFFVCFIICLAGDEIEITIYLFDVQFRAKFKQYKNRPYSVTVIITTAIYRNK